MNVIEKYINDTLGIKTKILSLKKQLFQQLPLYITSTYNVQETTFFGQPLCLLIEKNNNNTSSPDQLYKQMLLVSKILDFPVVFVLWKVHSYNLKRIVKKGINFIIPYKQMFIPALMMDLRKTPVNIPKKIEWLTPIAQLVLLYHLQKERLNGFTTRQLSDKFNQTYLTMSRAVKNLEELELCCLIGGKEKMIQFSAKGKELWLKAQTFFQNPVERIFYTDEYLNSGQALVSNINALAHYSMLNNETKHYYAIDRKDVKNLVVETNKHLGDNMIEIWRYNPYLLSDNEFVDKLSLYLTFKKNIDERVQNELEQMINEMRWLEE